MKASSILAGIGLGAALMYVLDPQGGPRRRALVRDKAASAWNKTREATNALNKDISNRAQGLYSQARSKTSQEPVPDSVLADRVRSKLGRLTSHPRSIDVSVLAGRVTLRGPVLQVEVEDVVDGVWTVRGVSDVDNLLEAHEEPGNIPGLQGPGSRQGIASGFMRYNWSPTHRALATGVGSGLVIFGASRRTNPLALISGLAGLAFALRGATNRELARFVRRGQRETGRGAEQRSQEQQPATT